MRCMFCHLILVVLLVPLTACTPRKASTTPMTPSNVPLSRAQASPAPQRVPPIPQVELAGRVPTGSDTSRLSNALAAFEQSLFLGPPAEDPNVVSCMTAFAQFDPASIQFTNNNQAMMVYIPFFMRIPIGKDTYAKLLQCYSNIALKSFNPRFTVQAYEFMGRIAWAMKDLDAAECFLRSAGDAPTQTGSAQGAHELNLSELAGIYGELYDEKALLELGDVLKSSSVDAARYNYYHALMKLYCDLGEREKAKRVAEEVVEAIPPSSSFAKQARELGSFIRMFMMPRRSVPDPAFERAKTRAAHLFKMGREAEARKCFAEAVTQMMASQK